MGINRKIIKILGLSLGVVTPITIASIGLSMDRLDYPTKGHDVHYSTKKSKENLVEIFSDGLDYRYLKSLVVDNSNFKDFVIMEQFADQGKSTAFSLPIIFGEYKEYNYWNILKKYGYNQKNNKKELYRDLIYSQLFAETMVKHMNQLDQYNINFEKTIIHPVNAAQDASYASNAVGDYQSIKKRDNQINVINWAQARDKIASNGWSISLNSASGFAYKYAAENALPSPSNRPARVLINDMVTHFNYFESETTGFEPFSGNIAHSYNALTSYIEKYLNSLKKIQSSDGTSAYDNSMIIIYGDHANHSSYDGTKKVNDILHKNHSLLLIKYPHFNNHRNKPFRINNRTIFGGDIIYIIKDYFKNKKRYYDDGNTNLAQNQMFNFLETNSNFDGNKIMVSTNGYGMQFNSDHNLINIGAIPDQNKPNFDPSQNKKYWGWS